MLIGTSVIWPFHPEKCLCVSEKWAEANPDPLHALLRALLRAQVRCDDPTQAPAIARMLADPAWLALPEEATVAALPGGSGAEQIRFHSREAWFPATAHALWFLGQMQRWGWLPTTRIRMQSQPPFIAPTLRLLPSRRKGCMRQPAFRRSKVRRCCQWLMMRHSLRAGTAADGELTDIQSYGFFYTISRHDFCTIRTLLTWQSPRF